MMMLMWMASWTCCYASGTSIPGAQISWPSRAQARWPCLASAEHMASLLRLRGGKELQELDSARPCTEGPQADDGEIGTEMTQTVNLEQNVDDDVGWMAKETLREAPAGVGEDDAGTGEVPLAGDLVSIRITIWSESVVRATTETLLQLADEQAEGGLRRRTHVPGAAAPQEEDVACLTPQEAGQTPLQMQYGYGGLSRVAHAIEARAIPGAFSFRLGAQTDNIVPGFEEALLSMRRGELARVTVAGDKGFDHTGFRGVARTWGIAPNSSVVAEVELLSINTIDASGDGGVLVTLPHTSALQLLRLRTEGQWRLLERRPSAHATVKLSCAIRAVHHVLAGVGNTTTVVPPDEQQSPQAFAAWVHFGKGELPWGMELAAVGTAVAGVPFSVRLTGARYLDSCDGEGAAGREGCGAEAMTYDVIVEDWHEQRNLTADGGVVLHQRHVGKHYNANTRPIADGDDVLLDICGRTMGEGTDCEVEWTTWPPSSVRNEDAVHEGDGQWAGDEDAVEVAAGSGSAREVVCRGGWEMLAPGRDSGVSTATQTAPSADAIGSWLGGSTWRRARREVTVGNFAVASGLERALVGLRLGQAAQVRIREPYRNILLADNSTRIGGVFGPAQAAGLEFSFTVLALRPATRKPLAARVAMAARRRKLGNLLFAQGKYEDALTVYRLGADLVFHWKASAGDREDSGDTETLPLSPYEKSKLREATAHMTQKAKTEYTRAMEERARQKRAREKTTRARQGVLESATGEGTWDGEVASRALIRQAETMRAVCMLNGAQCLLKLKRAGEARQECDAVLEENEDNARAYFRRCLAHLALQRVHLAQDDYRTLVRLRSKETTEVGDGAQVISEKEMRHLEVQLKRAKTQVAC